ncbi:spore germination protein [Caldicoprobacter algeriensis]|uniref:GerAB/ArcD/ProY family transporter n=1 Tax=Caldicoprobacter algeriensis TaxID=699281 RepID=UPI00207AFB04|nr:GerAB/ArcD/ProY family transporter [Caldicoprobacter algeriensis]MCM8900273.1 spore germination protein [Caldicoprobacter algeriensis]
MVGQGKFGNKEAISALVIACMAKEFFTDPNMIVRKVGTAGWYMVLVSAAVAALGFTAVYFLLKRFPGKNIMEIYDDVFGRYIGFGFSFTVAFVLLFSAAMNLREYVEIIKIYVFPKTPPVYLIGSLAVTAVILSFIGLENITRYSKLAGYVMLVGFIILLMLSSRFFRFYRIYPLLGYGLKNTLVQGFLRSSIYGEITLVAIFAKSLHGIQDIRKVGYTSLIIAASLMLLMQLGLTLIFTYPFSKELTAPLYAGASLIHYGVFFQRVESLFLFIWNISTLISIPLLFYMVLLIYSYLFKIDDIRPITVPFSFIMIALSLIPSNIVELVQFYIRYLREFGWVVFYVLPSIALLMTALTKKKGWQA